jgi:hypothetical protein
MADKQDGKFDYNPPNWDFGLHKLTGRITGTGRKKKLKEMPDTSPKIRSELDKNDVKKQAQKNIVTDGKERFGDKCY